MAGKVPNTRLHVMMVAFPGFCKTFFQQLFLEDENDSLIKGSFIPCRFAGDMTNAHFVGRISSNPMTGEMQYTPGLCDSSRDYIIGIDEFSAVTKSQKQDYNFGLDTNLLKALDSGDIQLGRAAGEKEFHTDLTLWAGTQPARYDLGSGFSRRFLFLPLYPSMEDVRTIDRCRDESRGINTPPQIMRRIKMSINQKYEEIWKNISGVYFGDEFKKELNSMNLFHYEKDLMERLALGYQIMKQNNINGQIYIGLDSEIKRLIHLQDKYRREVQLTSPSKIISSFLSSEIDNTISQKELEYTLVKMGMNEQSVNLGIRNLIVLKKIEKVGENLKILKI